MCDQKSGINVSALEGSERISGSGLNHQSIPDKKIFESSEEDSGFLSGPQNLYSSESLDSQHFDSQHFDSQQFDSKNIGSLRIDAEVVHDEFRDSGAIIPDDEDEPEDNTKEPMIFKRSVDVGLSEWFCKLNFQNSSLPLNNLSNSRKSQEEPKLAKQFSSRPLWEICYVQDADGDT